MNAPDSADFLREAREIWTSLDERPERPAGSQAEAACADLLYRRFDALDLLVQKQRFETPAGLPLVLFAQMVLIVIAGLLIGLWPTLAFLALAVLGVALWGELSGRLHLLWPSLAKWESHNLIAQWQPETATRQVLIVAAMDTGRTARIVAPAWLRALAHAPLPLYPAWGLLVIAGGLVFLSGAAAFGAQGALLWSGIWALVALAGGAAYLLGEWAFGPSAARTRDNTAGLALMMGLAQEVAIAKPQDEEWCFIALGAGQANRAGAIHYLRELGGLYDPERALVVVLDDIGHGPLLILEREGLLGSSPYAEQEGLIAARKLLRQGTALADIGRATRLGTTDAWPFTQAGFMALTLSSEGTGAFAPGLSASACDSRPDDAKLLRARDFIRALVASTR